MQVPMTKVHVIGHRRRLDATMEALQQLRAIHLVDVTEDSTVRLPPMAVDEDHVHELEEVRYLRARLEGLLGLLAGPMPVDSSLPVDLTRLRGELEAVGPEIESLVRHRDGLTNEAETLPRHLDSLRRLLPLVPELGRLESYDTMAVTIDSRHAGVLGELSARLTDLLTGNFEIISDQIAPGSVGAVVVFPRRARSEVEMLLGRQQVSRLRLPHRYETMPFREAIGAMERRLAALPGEIEDARSRIESLVRPHREWPAAVDMLTARQGQLQAIRRVGATPHTFVVTGWVPSRRIGELRAELDHRVGADVLVETADRRADEEPPVELDNPPLVRPFHPLVRLLALPRYGFLDATSLMAFFLPLFFGVMLGDVAYGAILMMVAVIVTRRFGRRSPTVADLGRVFLLSSAWAIVWGFVYGEMLGDLGHRLFGMRPLWINREEALEPLLVFALVLGGAHVLLGLILGLWQARVARDGHLVVERLGHLAALIGLFLVTGVFAGLLPDGMMTPAVAAVVVGLVVLIGAGGPMGILLGPLELMGTIGNVLSYLRLAAIGLASVYLARVANELGAVGPVWLGVCVAALFHALNLVLGAFSPAIQALRLHYVEFFGKFYLEGGAPYVPFGDEGPVPSSPPASTGSSREE